MARLKSKSIVSSSPTFKEIKKWYEEHLHPDANSYDDPEVYKYVYHDARWASIFQCVDGESLITTKDGLKTLKSIEINDIVVSFNESKEQFEHSKVINVFDKGEKDCIEINFPNRKLVCTVDHKIFTKNRGWVLAGSLTIEDDVYVCSLNNPKLENFVKIYSIKETGKRHVYDIEVENNHNFIANDIIVHNCTSKGAQEFFVKAKPESVTDIAALTSIYRPGPLAANVDKIYLDAKKGKTFDWGHPLFEKVLGETYNSLVFQEQVMDLCEHVGGFPKDQCDNVRRAIMKRDHSKGDSAQKEALALKESFVKGAIAKGVDEKTASQAYDNILYFAGYGFNRSFNVETEIVTYSYDGKNYIETKKQAKNIVPGDVLKARNEKTKKEIFVKVINNHDHGILPLYKVTLSTGETVSCTMNHKFRTIETGEMLPLWLILKRKLSIVTQNSTVSSA